MAAVDFINPQALHSNPAFTQVVTVAGAGRHIFIGGQNAIDAQGQVVGVGDLGAQTEQALRNLQIALAAAGATPAQVILWRVYVVQGQALHEGFAAFQRLWPQRVNPPAITVLQVAGLAHPDFLLEIEAQAFVPQPA